MEYSDCRADNSIIITNKAAAESWSRQATSRQRERERKRKKEREGEREHGKLLTEQSTCYHVAANGQTDTLKGYRSRVRSPS